MPHRRAIRRGCCRPKESRYPSQSAFCASDSGTFVNDGGVHTMAAVVWGTSDLVLCNSGLFDPATGPLSTWRPGGEYGVVMRASVSCLCIGLATRQMADDF